MSNPDFEEPLGSNNWTVVYVYGGPSDFAVHDRTTIAHKDKIPGTWDGEPNYLDVYGAEFQPYHDGKVHAYFKQTVSGLKPGSNYVVSCWMVHFTDLSTNKVLVYLEAMGGAAGTVSRTTPYVTKFCNNNPSAWQMYAVTNAASTNGQIEVRLHCDKNKYTTLQWPYIRAYYDHVAVMLQGQTAPAILTQPSATNVCLGQTATFTVSATGDGTLGYQWFYNIYTRINGATNATLTITNIQTINAGYYSADVSNGYETTSANARLTIGTTITQPPSSQSVWPGSNATFSMTATGNGTLTYQWRKNSSDLSDGGHYSGATTATLTISGVDASDVADYACAVTGGCGSVTSSNVALALLAGTIYGKLQLQGFTGTGPQTVRFVASDASGVALQTNDLSLSFAGSPKLASYTLSVPTNTAYVSAKTAWNLRRRQAVTFIGGVATNDFSGTAGQLLGGDISQDNNLVNTADYTGLKGNWLKSTASADLTGDGLVNTTDYTILKGNWLKTGDPQ